MSTSKLLRISIAVFFVLGVIMIASPAAAEKWKWHGTSFTKEVQKMDVGDEEGHILLLSKAQQLYVNETTGEKAVGRNIYLHMGTGKFEGIKGGGTFTMYTMGQGQPAYIEAEADVEIPAK